MTDLQLALIALGALIIIAVVLFNWWQERKLHKETESRFVEPETDVLMDEDFRIDPHTVLRGDKREEPEEEEFVVRVRIQDDEPAPQVAPSYAAEPSLSVEEPEVKAAPAISESSVDQAPVRIDSAEDVAEEEAPAVYASTAASDLPPEQEPVAPAQSEEPVVNLGSATAPWDEPAAEPEQADAPESIALPADVDAQIDLSAILYLPRPYSGAALRQQFLNFSEIDKPVYAFGLDAFREWHLLTREQEQGEFTRCVCSLQMADRSGAVSREMLIRFQNAAEDIALNLGAQVEWQGAPDPLVYAQALDAFCIEVDKLVSLHIVQGSNGPFTGTKFRGLAEASGLVLGNDGAFHYRDEQGHTSFSLINQDSNPFNADMLRTVVIKGVVFQLDIPHVKNCTEVFNQMVLAARQMSHSLNANLVDDNYRQLTDTQIDRIRQQLKMLHAQMITRGIMPGGQTAARLFS
ncbi:cell division protein ZipA C-terminal FtsZ-binding domain-containing protein [Methylovorus glucosotrophus]|uniref:Cell division protein ZipA n=1 Tax=Methylovorus glucosotrophus (strain SIP3-4) TaxID=582744 RepID=C6XDD8_METGS|nr:cell division protein ZipA C-terminal FtsZ-binding domain-containing protein [Methylovorus glucosotrophus]ACT50563.1 ZipA FtsZ-binding region [Methylovorus glucosotrophus SIP3-4]